MKESRLTLKITTQNSEETIELGKAIGKVLPKNSVITLYGGLGAGKTHLIKGLAAGVSQIQPEEVHSPTFTYLHIYGEEKKFYHFDLYRLSDDDEFLSMGFDEYFEADGVCCLEWAERIPGLIPPSIKIEMQILSENERELLIHLTSDEVKLLTTGLKGHEYTIET